LTDLRLYNIIDLSKNLTKGEKLWITIQKDFC
jgi:hypothetical protein